MALMQKVGEEMNQTLDQITAKIANGTITTRSQAVHAVQAGCKKAFSDQHADGGNYMVLPVIGG